MLIQDKIRSKEEYVRIANEIMEICRKYNVTICGSCWSEGINGEIMIQELEDGEEPYKFTCGNEFNFAYSTFDRNVEGHFNPWYYEFLAE